jgi:hypothetical protein
MVVFGSTAWMTCKFCGCFQILSFLWLYSDNSRLVWWKCGRESVSLHIFLRILLSSLLTILLPILVSVLVLGQEFRLTEQVSGIMAFVLHEIIDYPRLCCMCRIMVLISWSSMPGLGNPSFLGFVFLGKF